MLTVGSLFSRVETNNYLKAMPDNNNMVFVKGYIPSEETKRKMAISAKKRCTPEWRKNLSNKYSTLLPYQELKQLYEKGMTQNELAKYYNVSQKVIWKAMKNNSIKARLAAKRNQWNSNNHMWKGNLASYKAFHQRLYKLLGKPNTCEVCGTTNKTKYYDWANLSGKFNEPSDYKRMCRSCHWKYDKKYLNFRRGDV